MATKACAKSQQLDSVFLCGWRGGLVCKAISSCLKQANRSITNQLELAKANHKGIDLGKLDQ